MVVAGQIVTLIRNTVSIISKIMLYRQQYLSILLKLWGTMVHFLMPNYRLQSLKRLFDRGEETSNYRHFAVSLEVFSDRKHSWHPLIKVKFARDEDT